MIILVGVPLVLAGSYGYYYFTNNKKKVLEKALDMYASIIVYSKDKLKYIKNTDFNCRFAKIVYYDMDVKHERSIKSIFNDVVDNNIVVDIDSIVKSNEITGKDHRIVFNYNYEDHEYFSYITSEKHFKLIKDGEELTYTNRYPVLNNEMFELFKKDMLMNIFNPDEDLEKSMYVTLTGDLKDIQSVKLYNKETEEYESDINENLKEMFTKIKGPFNDWGLLTLNLIRNKWIYHDFGIDKKYKVIIEQGLYLNDDTYDLESDVIEIDFNDDFIKLPTLYRMFKEKLDTNNIELRLEKNIA